MLERVTDNLGFLVPTAATENRGAGAITKQIAQNVACASGATPAILIMTR
jgi:hypothetical protein